MSNKARIRRIKRLIRVSETKRDVAEARLAAARAQVEAAAQEVIASERRVEQGAERMVKDGARCAADFVDAYAYMAVLREDAEKAHDALREAEVTASERQSGAREAYREVRKMELWGESTMARQREEESRVEQRQNDELAARLTSGRDE